MYHLWYEYRVHLYQNMRCNQISLPTCDTEILGELIVIFEHLDSLSEDRNCDLRTLPNMQVLYYADNFRFQRPSIKISEIKMNVPIYTRQS